MQSQAVQPKVIKVARPWPFLVLPQDEVRQAAARVVARTRQIWAIGA